MKKISNREEANNYYKLVSNGVEEFAKQTKARPSEIHSYLSKNGKVFLKRLEVDEVSGIENVLQDVLLHRKHMEDDKVVTFESFSKVNENLFDVGLPTVEHEKVLADIFSTSLGHIDTIDSNLHFFKINDFGKEIYSIIFSSEEITKIKENLKSKLTEDIISKVLTINSIDSVYIDPIKFWISDCVDESKLNEIVNSKLSSSLVLNFIVDSFNKSLSFPVEVSKFSNYKEVNGFSVWFS